MSKIGITIDVDWAPDFMIDYAYQILKSNNVKSTWFVTHESEAIFRMMEDKNVEIGLHPNFSNCPDLAAARETLDVMTRIYPAAKIIRGHKNHQNIDLTRMASDEFGIKIDCSDLLFGCQYAHPFYYYAGKNPIVKIPYVWEDCMEARKPKPCWQFSPHYHNWGVSIYSFHPLHIFMNSSNLNNYDLVKKKFPFAKMITPKGIKPFINKRKPGSGSMFSDIAKIFSSRLISEIVKEWKEDENIGAC